MKVRIVEILMVAGLCTSWTVSSIIIQKPLALDVIEEKELEIKPGEELRNFEGPEFTIDQSYFSKKVPKDLTQMDESLVGFDDLLLYLTKINEHRGYGYYHVGQNEGTIHNFLYDTYSEAKGGYDWDKVRAFQPYYKKLFRSEIARKAMFEYFKPALRKMADEYPDDWNTMVLQQLDELISFTQKFDPSKEISETGFSKDTGGKTYFEGFIARRIKFDQVPKAEILSYLTEVQTMIQGIVPNSKYDAAITFKINREIEVTRGAGQFLIQANNGQRYIVNDIYKMMYILQNQKARYEFYEHWSSESPDVIINL